MHSEQQALTLLQKQIPDFPEKIAVLGSGWKKVLDQAKIETEIGYEELFGVKASVPGHEGKLVIAQIGQSRVAVMSGRFHMYEGFTAREVTLPLRVFAQAGAKEVLLTAACGAINELYQVGDFVLLSDLLTLFLVLDNPLVGPEFQDMSQVFDANLRDSMRKVLVSKEASFKEGIYAYYHGPNFETPADKMAFKILGADVVGMSTVPEAIMAKRLGMKIIGLSFVTNLAFVKHEHEEVLAAAEAGSQQMVQVLQDFYS